MIDENATDPLAFVGPIKAVHLNLRGLSVDEKMRVVEQMASRSLARVIAANKRTFAALDFDANTTMRLIAGAHVFHAKQKAEFLADMRAHFENEIGRLSPDQPADVGPTA